jgi:hypothetical protein
MPDNMRKLMRCQSLAGWFATSWATAVTSTIYRRSQFVRELKSFKQIALAANTTSVLGMSLSDFVACIAAAAVA